MDSSWVSKAVSNPQWLSHARLRRSFRNQPMARDPDVVFLLSVALSAFLASQLALTLLRAMHLKLRKLALSTKEHPNETTGLWKEPHFCGHPDLAPKVPDTSRRLIGRHNDPSMQPETKERVGDPLFFGISTSSLAAKVIAINIAGKGAIRGRLIFY